jgi:hypothetical protein
MDMIKEECDLHEATSPVSSVKEEQVLDIKYEGNEGKVSAVRI